MSKDLKSVFEEYAAFGRPGHTKDITSKNFSKLIKEKGLIDKKLTNTEVDMVFTRAKPPGTKVLTYAQFENALKMCANSKYGSDTEEQYQKIKGKICGGAAGPSTSGTTVVSKTGGVEKLTDASKYTGSHKERFDESGKGKGISGRKDVADNTAYVQGYKGKDTFDKKH